MYETGGVILREPISLRIMLAVSLLVQRVKLGGLVDAESEIRKLKPNSPKSVVS